MGRVHADASVTIGKLDLAIDEGFHYKFSHRIVFINQFSIYFLEIRDDFKIDHTVASDSLAVQNALNSSIEGGLI